jgi:amino acid transporter
MVISAAPFSGELKMNTNKNTQLTLFPCIMFLTGGMIGSAIFSLSGITFYSAGPAVLVSWFIGALIMLGFGLVTAELSGLFPNAGSIYVFPVRTFSRHGELLGWLSAWGYLIASIAANGFNAVFIAQYLSNLFPALKNIQLLVACIAIGVCFLINIMHIASMGKVNTALTIGLIITILVFLMLTFSSGSWNINYWTPFFTQGTYGKWGFMRSIPNAMLAYGGVIALSFNATEIINPAKTIPKATIASMVIVTAIYLLILTAMVGTVSASSLAENERYMPLYAVSKQIRQGPFLGILINISAILALLTTLIVMLDVTSRLVQVIAVNHYLPSVFGKMKNGVPFAAILLVTIISAFSSFFPNVLTSLTNISAFFSAATVIITCLSLVSAQNHFKEMNKINTFHLPSGYIIPLLVSVACTICYIAVLDDIVLIGVQALVIYIIGCIIYYLRRRNPCK